MINLDMRTVLVADGIMYFMGFIIMILLWAQTRTRFKGIGLWVLNFIIGVIGFGLTGFRDTLPDWASIFLGNLLIFGGSILLLFGFCRFTSRKISAIFTSSVLAIFVIFAFVQYYYSVVTPLLLARNLGVSSWLVIWSLFSLMILLKWTRETQNQRYAGMTILALIFVIMISAIRIIGFLTLPQPATLLDSGVFDTFMVLLLGMSIAFLALSLILLVNGLSLAEAQRARDGLKVSETRYRRLFESAKDGILILDAATGVITDVNPFLSELLGSSHGEFKGRKVWEPGFLKKVFASQADFAELQRKEYMHFEDFPLETADGRRINVAFMSNAYEVDHQKVVQCNIRDITKRKRTEDALRESEGKLKAITENIADTIIQSDRNGNITFVNRLLPGLTREQVFTSTVFDYVPDEQRQVVKEALTAVFERGEATTYESYGPSPDGEVRTYDVRVSPIFAGGRVISAVFLARDITERKKAEEYRMTLERSAQNAARLASIGEMASGVAHEINNPLTPALLFSQMLLKQDLPEDVKDDLRIIHESARRAADVTRRMLTFARHNKPQRILCDINKVVETTLEFSNYNLESNKVKIVTDLDPSLPVTLADAGQLQQVVLNLIMNAEYALAQIPGERKLTVQTKHNGDIIRLSVKDNGPGIAAENMEKLFTPFFTTKKVGEGTGLGLSVCHGIVAGHGGRIYAESEEGKGATFIVELPVVLQPVEAVSAPPEPDWNGAAAAFKHRILVVEDEATIVQIVKRILTGEGYAVEAVGNAEEALKLMGKEDYAAILLDIKLPDMTGIELYQRLEKTDRSSLNKIVFITGDVMGTETIAFFSRTGAHYISKPFDIDQLLKEVRRKV